MGDMLPVDRIEREWFSGREYRGKEGRHHNLRGFESPPRLSLLENGLLVEKKPLRA